MRQALRVGVTWQCCPSQLCSVKSIKAQIKACACSSLQSPEVWMQSFPSVLFLPRVWLALRRQSLSLLQSWMGEICMRVIWGLLLADNVLFQRLHIFGFSLQCHQVFLARMTALSWQSLKGAWLAWSVSPVASHHPVSPGKRMVGNCPLSVL